LKLDLPADDPALQMIVPQPDPAKDPTPPRDQNPVVRNPYTSDVRLIQMDFAVRDDRTPTGWVFGTFMFDGTRKDTNVCFSSRLVGMCSERTLISLTCSRGIGSRLWVSSGVSTAPLRPARSLLTRIARHE
jgi:hypothetical protein